MSWKTILPVVLALLVAGTAVHAGEGDEEDPVVVRHVLPLRDCPEVKVLGAGHARVLSLSPHGFLGVEASSLTPELRRHFGVPDDAGVMLSRVLEGSAAAAAGLAVGDVVTRVDGEEITSAGGLGRAIRHKEGGGPVDIEYWRDGTAYEARATLEERERCSFDIGDSLRALDLGDLPELGELGTLGLEIGGEAMETALEALQETLGSQDWQKHLEHLEGIDLESIELRMEAVQEKLEEIERRLEREYGDDLERAEQALERAERDRARAARDRERAERERQRSEKDSGGDGGLY